MSDFKHAELVGPFNDGDHFKVSVGGYLVPHLVARKSSGAKDGEVEILLDNRLAFMLNEDKLDIVMSLVANAMAVAAGYSCHGENCTPTNLHKIKLVGLS